MDHQAFLARVIRGVGRARPETAIAAVDLGASFVDVALALREFGGDGAASGPARVVDSRRLPCRDPREAARAAADFFSRREPATALAAVLPRRLAIIRVLELPAASPVEMRAMARLQALRDLPFDESEVLCDAWPLAREGERATAALAVVRRGDLAAYRDFFEALGRAPDGFVLSAACALELVRRDSAQPVRWLHLALREDGLDVEAFDGRLRASRSVPLGRRPSAERAIDECRRTFAAAGLEGASLERVLLTGPEFAEEPEFAAALSAALGAPVAGPPAPREAALCRGAALAPRSARLGLLPSEFIAPASARAARAGYARAGAWLAAWLAILAAADAGRYALLRRRLSALEARIERAAPSAREAGQYSNGAALARSLRERTPIPLDVLREARRLAPAGATLTTVSCEPDGTCRLDGTTPSLAAVMQLLVGLQRSPLFAGARLRGSSVLSGGRADFVIEARCRAARSASGARKRG